MINMDVDVGTAHDLEKPTWFQLASLCEQNIKNQQANLYSPEDIAVRENLLLPYVKNLSPEQLSSLFIVNLPLLLQNSEKVLSVLASIPIEKLSLDLETKQKLSAFAIMSLQKFDTKGVVDSSDENPVAVSISRGLSRRGLLDWSNFLEPQDMDAVKQSLEDQYARNLIGSMSGKAHNLIEPKGKFVRKYSPVVITEMSKKALEKYFSLSELGILQDFTASSQNPGYVNEMSSIFIGKPNMDNNFANSGYPMHINSAGIYMPAADLRLNVNFTKEQENIRSKAKMLSELMSYAQVHGIPIVSKLTTADDQSKYCGRILIYTDHSQLRQLIAYIKQGDLISIDLSVAKLGKDNFQMQINDNIEVRGNGEGFTNDARMLEESFNKIVSQFSLE